MVQFVFEHNVSTIFLISQILVTIAAVFLLGLTIKSWKNTKINKLIYVIVAFSLFAFIHILNFIDHGVVDVVSDDIRYAITSISDIVIMVMFVLAIIKK